MRFKPFIIENRPRINVTKPRLFQFFVETFHIFVQVHILTLTWIYTYQIYVDIIRQRLINFQVTFLPFPFFPAVFPRLYQK